MGKSSKISGVLLYIVFIILSVFFLSELILRIWNPFQFRQGDKEVILPRNRKMEFTNDKIPQLAKKIIHTKNSLGFRGPEPPANLQNHTSIIAVGGSTTECFYLDDSICWTNLLQNKLKSKIHNTWINNAGFQGHSTYGNFILINDYIKYLKPKYILLMEGINEVDRPDIKEDESIAVSSKKNSTWGWIKRNSRVVNVSINIRRNLIADQLGVTDSWFDPVKMGSLQLSQRHIDSSINKQLPLINAYSKRLNEIIDTCMANNIQPILITQPILYGDGKDCISNTDLSTIKITKGYNGKLFWNILELYNDKTRQSAKEKNLLLIDLAAEMPKCSKYYYDICHFTNEGSVKVSEILASYLTDYFR